MRRRHVARMLAVLCLAAGLTLTPGGAAVAQAPASPNSIAAKVTELTDTLTTLRQRQTDAQAALTAADQRITALSGNVDQLDQRAAALVASARQEAVQVYVEGEPASTPFALVNALALNDVNDAAWSLGVLRVSHAQSLDLLRQATAARPAANTELTAAITQRDTLRLELARIAPVITNTEADLQAAQSSLDTYVLRLAPTTVEGLTTVVFDAYQRAAARLAVEQPQCGLRWELLAAIGKTESNHGAGRIDVNGNSITHIIGIPIGPDTDGGALDDDAVKDHAVGPMQFIPIAWNTYGADGNGDGKADPHNIFDATLAAGRFLCKSAGALTLLTREGVIRAIWAYNPNDEYLRVVGARFEALASDVANGWFSSADLPKPAAPAPDPGAATPGVDGNQPPAAPVTAPPSGPPATVIHTVAVFTADGLAVPTAGAPVPATCAAGSGVLAGRSGLLRCVTSPAGVAPEALDPCQVAPFDPTLLACLPDPEQPARLVRVATPLPVATPSPAPPYYALVLTGGDRCLPVAGAGAAPPPPVTPTVPPGGAVLRFAPAPATAQASALAPAIAPAQAPDPTTTTTSTPDPTTTTTTTTTTAASTTTTTVAATTTTTAPTTTTTVDPNVTSTTTTTVAPTGPFATYRCSSGADITTQPNTGAAAWTVQVHQPAIADRQIGVIAAWV